MPALNGKHSGLPTTTPICAGCCGGHWTRSAFEVAESSNGEQALKQVETHQFHAILLDVNMPGAGGIATCREMRRKTRGCRS